MKSMKLKTTVMHGLILVERNHEGDDENYLFEHKHYKIRQIPSHTSKIVATNNFKTLTSWSCSIQNGM
jgi:hypothetical protein